jgi:uracil-DNA glycosylase
MPAISFHSVPVLDLIVERIRSEQGLAREVPGFDPSNGNERARFLLLLEAPGPKAVESGFVSLDNDDNTARNLRKQLQQANIARDEIVLWNVVPWYLGNSAGTKIRAAKRADITKCLAYLSAVVASLKKLECIVLVGGTARKAHVYLSHETDIRILGCHHTSQRVQNTLPGAAEQNVKVFRRMAAGRI